jgi:hypothetical protein
MKTQARPSPLRSLALGLRLLLLLGLASVITRAEPVDLTDLVGRTIRAELISLDGETLTIRREDGRDFAIELKSLSDADQAKVLAWNKERLAAAANDAFASAPAPKPAPADTPDTTAEPAGSTAKTQPKYVADMAKVTLALSRFKAGTTTLAKGDGYSHKHEQWGYSFQVSNRNLYPVDKVRIEYNLFARTFYDSSTPSVVSGALDVPSVASNRSETVKTKTAEVCKLRGYYTSNTGGELRGIWVKLYVDDTLINEQVSPESLRTTEEWRSPSSSRDR